jgi:hypothetical protein
VTNSRVWDEVDRRLAERLSGAGVPEAEIAQAVLFLLPRDFVNAYEALYHRALKVAGDKGLGARVDVLDEKTGETESFDGVGRSSGGRASKLAAGKTLGEMGGAKKGKAYKKAWIIADEIALEKKVAIDKRLRKMARELRSLVDSGVGEGSDERKKCMGKKCAKWLELGWKYCPSCGARQRSGDGDG